MIDSSRLDDVLAGAAGFPLVLCKGVLALQVSTVFVVLGGGPLARWSTSTPPFLLTTARRPFSSFQISH